MEGEKAVDEKVDVGLPGKDLFVSRRCLRNHVLLVIECYGVLLVGTGC